MRRNIIGVPVDDLSWPALIEQIAAILAEPRLHLITTINPEMVVAAQSDSAFLAALTSADLAVCDGMGVWIASWWLGRPVRQRIAGVDLVEWLLNYAAIHQLSIYLLGGQPASLVAETAAAIHYRWPKLRIVGADDGGQIIPGQWNPAVAERVRAAAPDILLVAFGHGRQERWIADHRAQLGSVRLALGVGGVFNFLAGTIQRAPRWLRILGLEWLWRFGQQPWRWRRILVATVQFCWLVVRIRFSRQSINT